ncbi:hypothetical protein I4F81_003761 [Pyropia yezoensis]|uniref:Uncharacterized protein n=1 Tax=Pyropia yezoensis TaxID=2788 RepID=A0ACC3BUI3_PYRYE|nr:hypothetical protein I4F81_003761 [Neopyropia yezoensis]
MGPRPAGWSLCSSFLCSRRVAELDTCRRRRGERDGTVWPVRLDGALLPPWPRHQQPPARGGKGESTTVDGAMATEHRACWGGADGGRKGEEGRGGAAGTGATRHPLPCTVGNGSAAGGEEKKGSSRGEYTCMGWHRLCILPLRPLPLPPLSRPPAAGVVRHRRTETQNPRRSPAAPPPVPREQMGRPLIARPI